MHQKYKNNALVPCVRVERVLERCSMDWNNGSTILEKKCWNTVNCHPLCPQCNVENFRYLQQLANVSQNCLMREGEGRNESDSVFYHSEKNTGRFEFGNLFTHYFLKRLLSVSNSNYFFFSRL